jgi:hypothetical protein|tara:strand:+ start:4933 stop:5148 length:216 start_codon:yes stop_codon:yes gene_type:complete
MTLAIGFKTKKELKSKIGQDISGYIIETSFFGNEYHSNVKDICVCVSVAPDRVRNAFATISVENDILTKVT